MVATRPRDRRTRTSGAHRKTATGVARNPAPSLAQFKRQVADLQKRLRDAEKRANDAEKRANDAEDRANDAGDRAALAEARFLTIGRAIEAAQKVFAR